MTLTAMRPDSGRSNGRETSLWSDAHVGVDLGLQRRLERQIRLDFRAVTGLPAPEPPAQVVDEHLRVDLLLDEERRRLHDEIGPVLRVLAAPDELRVEVAVAPLAGDLDRAPARRAPSRTGTRP